MSEFPVQVTIKPPATAASAPWLNFQAQDVDELKSQIIAAFPTAASPVGETEGLPVLAAKAYLEYAAILTAIIGLAAPSAPVAASIQSPGPAPQWAAPAAPAAPTGPPAPQCHHGEKIRRAGVTNKPGTKNHGQTWAAWFCPSPAGTSDQCKPDFG